MDLMVYKGLLAITVYFERESASTFSLELWTMSRHGHSYAETSLNLLGIWNDKEIMVLNRNGSWISFVYYGGGRNKNIPTVWLFFFASSSHQLTWFHLLETAEYVYEELGTECNLSLCLCEDADYELLSA